MISGFRGALFYALFGLALITCTNAMASPAQLQMRIVDASPLVVGQVVTVELSLISEVPIVGAAKFTLPPLDFGVWLEQSRASYNGFARRGGRRVPNLVTSYAVWIQKAGQFQVPGVQVRAPVLNDGVREYVQAQAPALPLLAQYPQAQASSQSRDFLVAQSAQISSVADFPPQLQVGQVIEQTVTIEAQGALPVSLPELDVASATEYRVDHLPVNSFVEYARGVVTSTQVMTLRYTLLESGVQQIPSYEIEWWNTDLHQFQTLRSKPFDIQVNTPDDASMSKSILYWLGCLVLGVLFVWSVLRCWSHVMRFHKKLKTPVLPERLNP